MQTCDLNPLDDRVVILPDELPKQTTGGILIPDQARKNPDHGFGIGTVMKVGPGKNVNGTRLPMFLSVGDRVLFGWYGGVDAESGGVTYRMMWESEVFCRLGTQQKGDE